MRVAVTGGTGFVGSHTVATLIEQGHSVRLLVRSPDRVEPALGPHSLDAPEVVVGDVTDRTAVDALIDGCAQPGFSSTSRTLRESCRTQPEVEARARDDGVRDRPPRRLDKIDIRRQSKPQP